MQSSHTVLSNKWPEFGQWALATFPRTVVFRMVAARELAYN
jgi:hypothetical protein